MELKRNGSQRSQTGSELDGKAVDWMEKVSDEQYQAR